MDSSVLQAYLRKVHPDRQTLQVCNLKDITSGWETEIHSFNLVWGPPEKRQTFSLVVRVFPGNESESKAEKEYRFMKELKNLHYPVPAVHMLETDSSILGNPFIIMNRIDGGTIEDRVQQSEENRDYFLDIVCKLFVKLHRIPWESLASESIRQNVDDPYYLITTTLDNYRDLLRRTETEFLLPIVYWLEKHVDSVPCCKPSIIHGDFHTMNILLDDGDNPFVIDWGAAQVNDYRLDLGWSLLLYLVYGSMEFRNDLLNRYESVLGHSVEQIEYFEVIACLRRLHDVFVSITRGGKEKGLRPEVTEMIKSTIQHVINTRNYLERLTTLSIPMIDEMIDSITE
jgi:aminoglycoside phosphotransferase (APT) family kinase protein